MTKENLGYWISSGLFCSVLGFSGVAHFGHLEAMVESMTALGYPTYFMTIIGLAKLLGGRGAVGTGSPSDQRMGLRRVLFQSDWSCRDPSLRRGPRQRMGAAPLSVARGGSLVCASPG